MEELTDMQRLFEATGNFRRRFPLVCELFEQGGVDLRSEIYGRMLACSRAGVEGDNRIVVLDVGCAPGTSIEQVVRSCNVTASRMNLSSRVHGIGVDLNPVCDISPEILSIGAGIGVGTDPVTEFREGNICNLPVSDSSVDVYYSGNTLIYVADSLRAFEEGYRVLRPGGVAVWNVHKESISVDLKFSDILRMTPGSEGVFTCTECPYLGDVFVVCRKTASDGFKGFPFEVFKELRGEDLYRGGPLESAEIARYYRSAIYRACRR